MPIVYKNEKEKEKETRLWQQVMAAGLQHAGSVISFWKKNQTKRNI